MTTNEQLDQIEKRANAAGAHVGRLCTREDRWRMSVPPRDDDSDMMLTQITDTDVPRLARALRAVLEVHRQDDDLVFACHACEDLWPCVTVQVLRDELEAES